MGAEDELIKAIRQASGRYSGYEVYSDWVACMALSIANACDPLHGEVWQKREQEYENIRQKYTQEEFDRFPQMLALLTRALEEDMRDVLGDVYMKAGLGSKYTGQFFTPFHLSVLCADMSLPKELPERISLNEPSCGGGGMVIAAACVLKKRGINYQRRMDVIAQDLDWKAVYMCYVQLSLLGIRARVVQGDTLAEPYVKGYPMERCFDTPARMGVLL